MNSKEFEDAVENLASIAKSKGMAFCFVAMAEDGESSYILMNANGEDVAFFAAEMIFDFCKRINEAEGLPVKELLDLTLKETVNYLKVMEETDEKVYPLLDDFKGDMN